MEKEKQQNKDKTEKKQKEGSLRKKIKCFKYLVIIIIILLLINLYFLVKEFAKFDLIDFVFTSDLNEGEVSPDIEIEDTNKPIKEDEQIGEGEEKTKQNETIKNPELEYENTGNDTFKLTIDGVELNSGNWQEDMKQKLEKYDKNEIKIRIKNSGDIPIDIIESLKENYKIEAVMTLEYEKNTGNNTFKIILGGVELDNKNWQEDMKQKLGKYDKNKIEIRVKNHKEIQNDIIESLEEINKQNGNILIIME